jgi:hypothetical protein
MPGGRYGVLPYQGIYELNPGAAAMPASDQEISWSLRFSVSG